MNEFNEIDFDILDHTRNTLYEIYLVLELIKYNPRIEYLILITQRFHDFILKNPTLSFINFNQFKNYLYYLKSINFENLSFDENTPEKQQNKIKNMFFEIMNTIDNLINVCINKKEFEKSYIENEFERFNSTIVSLNN